jgi:hypothetical protein
MNSLGSFYDGYLIKLDENATLTQLGNYVRQTQKVSYSRYCIKTYTLAIYIQYLAR